MLPTSEWFKVPQEEGSSDLCVVRLRRGPCPPPRCPLLRRRLPALRSRLRWNEFSTVSLGMFWPVLPDERFNCQILTKVAKLGHYLKILILIFQCNCLNLIHICQVLFGNFWPYFGQIMQNFYPVLAIWIFWDLATLVIQHNLLTTSNSWHIHWHHWEGTQNMHQI